MPSNIIHEITSSNWIEIGEAVIHAATATIRFYVGLYEFIYLKKNYKDSTIFADDKWAKVQVFSLSLIFKLWSLKHYRSPSFQQDMIDNLKNVAIPGTGVPLSIFCHSYWTCMLFILILNPLVCFCGAVNKARIQSKTLQEFMTLLCQFYVTHLLHPDDWFSFWRMNSLLVSYHSYTTQSTDYRQEDKWTFLTTGKELGVPVTPYMDKVESLVCKNKNIEGGMGIFFYKNAAFGGEWILQEKLGNADWLNDLLPGNAPLSTMRVITTSTWSLSEEFPLRKVLSMISSVSSPPDLLECADLYPPDTTGDKELLSGTDPDGLITNVSSSDSNDSQSRGSAGSPKKVASMEETLDHARKFVRAESGILRLGRSNAKTDHSSVLFDVDMGTGTIRHGTTNSHWYQLGLQKAKNCPWLPPFIDMTHHPDSPHPLVTGKTVPDLQRAIDVVVTSHFKMMPDVPIVGWDVSFTPQGIFLLEVNLSCNFFRGSFDIPRYIELVDRYWHHLEKIERLNGDCSSVNEGGGATGLHSEQKNGEMSAAFAVIGLFSTWWVYTRTNNTELASGIFFFFTMELLQAIQYYYIAPSLNDNSYQQVGYASTCSSGPTFSHPACETFANKFLTLVGFLHICLQPYFCHVINSSLTKSCKYKDRYRIIKRLCLFGGLLLFSRYFLSFVPELNRMDMTSQKSTEWLRGNNLCTFKTKAMWHLGWSVPMADPSYYVMGASIHSFLMFAPFFALYEKKGMILQGLFLFLFGPVMASLFSDNLMEQASIWCFFSIAQISIMLFLIRETLIVNWGRGGNISVFGSGSSGSGKSLKSGGGGVGGLATIQEGDEDGEDEEEEEFCRDFLRCEYCHRRGFREECEDTTPTSEGEYEYDEEQEESSGEETAEEDLLSALPAGDDLSDEDVEAEEQQQGDEQEVGSGSDKEYEKVQLPSERR